MRARFRSDTCVPTGSVAAKARSEMCQMRRMQKANISQVAFRSPWNLSLSGDCISPTLCMIECVRELTRRNTTSHRDSKYPRPAAVERQEFLQSKSDSVLFLNTQLGQTWLTMTNDFIQGSRRYRIARWGMSALAHVHDRESSRPTCRHSAGINDTLADSDRRLVLYKHCARSNPIPALSLLALSPLLLGPRLLVRAVEIECESESI